MARGDQIFAHREFLNLQGVYEHHGIDCGDGTVIHYRKPSETIERTSLGLFSQGNRIYVKTYPTSFIPDVVLHRAMSRLGERKYNLLFNNCEHFATWCKTGISFSQQVEDFMPVVSQWKPENLQQPLREALQGTDARNAEQLVHQALGEIKGLWNNLQPRYKQAIAEQEIWQKVAQQALQQNREDLARAALHKKLKYKKQAQELETQLNKLATMTKTLLQNAAQKDINIYGNSM
ncbi:lecithin retinol acyltransferase family protein [Spirulina subsalsa FACHB-351]|uniref:Lecithin retinol acyltransferase family protein n=1 Tax=Spirulina subsalsa FACHB-351 TaxID=234711 RepID=A0ABT3LB67_9CYAN|nr:lecithin retinol acyltransferase family protein [Spirulina subsalsa]MCW6038215.1 lecithin retinol acyltransferase family protein [Spirulina subsalsa FACHB-351]